MRIRSCQDELAGKGKSVDLLSDFYEDSLDTTVPAPG